MEDPDTEVVDEHTYGGLKVLCERAVERHYSDALVIRPTYVVGPHDYTHRFTYWIERIAEGDASSSRRQDYGIQFIDARDQARWGRRARRARRVRNLPHRQPHTAVHLRRHGPDHRRRRAAPDGTTIEWVEPAFLIEHEVDDSALPLWVPTLEPDFGLNCDPSHARAHGLTTRTLTDTVRETLEHERRSPTPNPGGTGWSREVEAQMPAAWDAR